jgi:pimeloyl-ACP methyl ester carboxylesterase
MELADGRMMGFAEWGDPEGQPVVFLHGTPNSRLWCPDLEATEAAGCRLVTVDRPGYGRSEPPPWYSLRRWTDDLVALADQLEIERFGLVAWSGGGMYGAACAAAIPDRLLGAGVVAGTGWPVDEEPGAFEELEDDDRRIHALVAEDPEAAQQLAAEVYDGWVSGLLAQPESLLDREHSPPVDNAHFDDPAWAQAFFGAVREAFRQGAWEAAWDAVTGFAPWGFALEDIGIEFLLWHGAQDALQPRRSLDYWAARIPRSSVRIWEDSGHMVVADHWGDILSDVLH